MTYETLGCHYDWCLTTPQLDIYQFYVSYAITICSYSFCIAITASLYSKALGNIPQVKPSKVTFSRLEYLRNNF